MNLHHLVQSLRDSAITLDEFSDLSHFGRAERGEIAGVIRGCRLVLEEIGARAMPTTGSANASDWMDVMEELELSRGRLDQELTQLRTLVRDARNDVDLELALTRGAKRIREHAKAELAVLALATKGAAAPAG